MNSQVSSPNPCSQPLLFNDLDSRKVVADFCSVSRYLRKVCQDNYDGS
jgi:hypothetical protein